jgi:hypothetical protein
MNFPDSDVMPNYRSELTASLKTDVFVELGTTQPRFRFAEQTRFGAREAPLQHLEKRRAPLLSAQ